MSARSLSRRLAPALAGAIVLAATVPAAAPGAGEPEAPPEARPAREHRERRAQRSGGCSLALAASGARVSAGEAATLAGQLSCAQANEAAGQTVEIEQHTSGEPGRFAAGSASTDASGSFSFTTSTGLQRSSVFFAAALGARSVRVRVAVAPAVSLSSSAPAGSMLPLARRRTPAGRAAAGASVAFSGAVAPAVAGARVVLQRESSSARGDWRRIATGVTGADGRYTLAHGFAIAGPVTVRVVARMPGMRPSVSEALSYEVAHRQNPRLTIFASQTSLPYGAQVSFHGTAQGCDTGTVTLLARGRRGAFTPVATAGCQAGGAYEFPPQTATRSGSYRVRSPTARSTSVFVGVYPLLSAALPAQPLAAGQALTLTGTLSPATPGQVIYLQRLNPGGVGYRVLAEATVGAQGVFSIETVLGGAPAGTYRLKVPRGPDLQAGAGAPFSVAAGG